MREGAADAAQSPRRFRTRVWAPIAVIMLLLVAAACAAVWVFLRAMDARTELEAAVPAAAAVQQQLAAGDTDAAQESVDDLIAHTARARELTGDFVWRAVEWVPFAGPNLVAVRTAAESADAVAHAAAPVLSLDVRALLPKDGRFDVAAIAALGPMVSDARVSVSEATSRLAGLDTGAVIEPVAEGVDRLAGALGEAAAVLESLDNAVAILPDALGASGPRNYLLLFQNNAEVRGQGGLVAAVMLLRVENGAITIADQKSSQDFAHGTGAVMDLGPEVAALYTDHVASFIHDTAMPPDFTLTAQLASAFWDRSYGAELDGGQVDAVLSFDPVALGYLLAATGPVSLATGETLTAENAVSLLLNQVYFSYTDPEVQDAVFADAAGRVVAALVGGGADMGGAGGGGADVGGGAAGAGLDLPGVVTALSKAVAEHRLLYWSTDGDEMALLAGSDLTGELPATNTEATVVGVFLNDTTVGKLDYYLHEEVRVDADGCVAGDTWSGGTVTVAVTLTSKVPPVSAGALPKTIGAGAMLDHHVATDVFVYGPVGASFGQVSAPLVASGTHLGRPVARMNVSLLPGESATVEATFLAAAEASGFGPLELRTTPLINPPTVTVCD